MVKYIIYGIVGLISGLMFYFLAIHHVEVRSEYDNGTKLELIKQKKFIPLWMISAMILFIIVAMTGKDIWHTVLILVFTMFAFNLSAVDILLRRIPNPILLGMILLQTVNIGVEIWAGADPIDDVVTSMVGLLLAYIIFTLPAIFKLYVGAGDVKYGSVIGYILGFSNFAEAMIVMAIAILIFYTYLKISKTGDMKTRAPMAPFLSIGMFAALLFPLF